MKTIITIIFTTLTVPILALGFYTRLFVEAFLRGYTDTGSNFVEYLRR